MEDLLLKRYYDLDKSELDPIINAVNHYPMTLEHAGEILEIMGEVMWYLSPGGGLAWLKRMALPYINKEA